MRRTPWLMVVAGLALAAPLSAQEGHMTVAPGARVRVTTQSPAGRERLEGVFRSATLDTLFIDPAGAGERRGVPRASVVALEGVVGTKGRSGLGALIGGGVGLAVGGIAAIACAVDPEVDAYFEFPCYAPLIVTVPSGAGLGALIGLAVRTDRWEPVTVPAASVTPLVWRGGVGLAVRIAF